MCSQPSFFPKYYSNAPIDKPMICDSNVDLGYENKMIQVLGGNVDHFVPLGYCSGYDAYIDRYYIYLVDEPKKIMWATFLDLSFDFSTASSLFKRALTFFAMIILAVSYCHVYEAHSMEFDKFLCALIAFDLTSSLKDFMEWLIFHLS